jgi:lipopolysaccharide/colanic/teichoic acid biosynthesis glycosyltransferase
MSQRHDSYHRWTKRALDVVASALGLLVLSPLLVAAALAIKLDSPGPILFRQVRVGRRMRPFQILKFRTMIAVSTGAPLTVGADARITHVGRILRKLKIDELPQLINVLRGEMSLVGPRPEVPRYVAFYPKEFAEILAVRPGITDAASIRYRDEATLLAEADDAEAEYRNRILPDKIALARMYIDCASLRYDLALIFKTISLLFR